MQTHGGQSGVIHEHPVGFSGIAGVEVTCLHCGFGPTLPHDKFVLWFIDHADHFLPRVLRHLNLPV